MKDSKTLFFIFGLCTHICIAENEEASRLTKQEHSSNGNDKKITKREYYAPEYNHERFSYPAYRFEYGVHDPQTGDIKKQYEERDGDSVRGYYSLMEADGSIRLVEYTADAKNGFQAIVKKIGNSHHPMKVTYHMNTATAPDHRDGGGGGGYAPNYHGGDRYTNNPHSLAPVLMHEPNHDDGPPAYTVHDDEQHQHQQHPSPPYTNRYEPPAVPHFEPPAVPHFEPPAYTNHPQQQYPQPSPHPVYELPAVDYDSLHYAQRPQYQHNQLHQLLQQHRPPTPGYVPYEPQHDTHHYEPPLVPAFPAPADYEHGPPSPASQSAPPPPPPLFAGGLPTAHGDYGSAPADEYHPEPLQFPAASRENDFGWPAAATSGDDEDDGALHRINLDDFQFPAAADFPAVDDDDERRRGREPSARRASAERPEYLRKYFEPVYRGHGGGAADANSFYAEDYSDDESKK